MTVPPTPQNSKVLIAALDREFSGLHHRARQLIGQTPDERLYAKLPNISESVGENTLRSAAAIEQTCGGLNSNLWDDPFEWTLPEQLSTSQLILQYLDEVEATRRHCFAGFVADADLFKTVSLPSEQLEPLVCVLLETLTRAAALQGRAFASAKILSAVTVPGVII